MRRRQSLPLLWAVPVIAMALPLLWAVLASFSNLDAMGRDETRPGRPSVRWVLVHMIEEYARHNGHADLLREVIDGVVGT